MYNGLGELLSNWVGTDDTNFNPSTGGGNMVTISDNIYDDGGVGDGNLTATILHPGGGTAVRETDNYYDWRDRLVATKQGVQSSEGTTTHRLITFNSYDNLGKVTMVQRYDGDGFTITTSAGEPQRLRQVACAQAETSYDDQGRVYETRHLQRDLRRGI